MARKVSYVVLKQEEMKRLMLTSGANIGCSDDDGELVGQLVMEIHERGADTSGPPSFQDLLSRFL